MYGYVPYAPTTAGSRGERGTRGRRVRATTARGNGFLPSRLDASVLEAHGMGTGASERELAGIQQKAETLESERPDETRDER